MAASIDETVAGVQRFLEKAVPEPTEMKDIDETKFDEDLLYRFNFLAEFMGLGAEDFAAINEAAPILAKLVPDITGAVYRKLFAYTVTKKHFVKKNEGFEGALPQNVADLNLGHEQIQMRRMILGRYLARLVTTSTVDLSFVKYLDYVGKIHTPKAGSKSINVPLLQMTALMGFINEALTLIVVNLGLPKEKELVLIRAFTKLLWVQMEFIQRHYSI